MGRLDHLPPEVILNILSYVNLPTRFALKLVGSRYISRFIGPISKPSIYEYVAELDERASNGRNPIHMATLLEQRNVLSWLFRNNFDICERDFQGHTALDLAVTTKNLDIVKDILEKSSSFIAEKRVGWTSLHYAAEVGSEGATILLLGSGEKAGTPHGKSMQFTPLYLAIRNGHIRLTRILLENGAQTESLDPSSNTVLYISAYYGNLAAVDLLLEKGANLKGVGICQTPLQAASQRGHAHIVRRLLAAGADANEASTRSNGRTAIQTAAKNGCLPIIQLLLRYGASLEQEDQGGFTPLHLAVQNGHELAVRLLLKVGADVTTRNDKNFTVLHSAVQKGYRNIVALLLPKAHRKMPNPTRDDSFFYYFERESGTTLLNARTSIHGCNALCLAAKESHFSTIQLLLKAKANVDASHGLYCSFWEDAISSGRAGLVLLLMEKANLNANDRIRSRVGKTMLEAAVNCGPKRLVELLLEKGGDPNTVDLEDGCRPFSRFNFQEKVNVIKKAQRGNIAKGLLRRHQAHVSRRGRQVG